MKPVMTFSTLSLVKKKLFFKDCNSFLLSNKTDGLIRNLSNLHGGEVLFDF